MPERDAELSEEQQRCDRSGRLGCDQPDEDGAVHGRRRLARPTLETQCEQCPGDCADERGHDGDLDAHPHRGVPVAAREREPVPACAEAREVDERGGRVEREQDHHGERHEHEQERCTDGDPEESRAIESLCSPRAHAASNSAATSRVRRPAARWELCRDTKSTSATPAKRMPRRTTVRAAPNGNEPVPVNCWAIRLPIML